MNSLEARAEEFRITVMRTLAEANGVSTYGFDVDSMQRIRPTAAKPGFPEVLGGLEFRMKGRSNYRVSILHDRNNMINLFVTIDPKADSSAPTLTRATDGYFKMRELPQRLRRLLKTVMADPA